MGVLKLKKLNTYVFLLMIFLLISCGCTDKSSSVQGEVDIPLKNFIVERINLFSEKHFSKLEKCEVIFASEENSVIIEFIPDFGAITFKNDIWHWAATHAMNLVYIFPEVTEYKYTVLDAKNNILMELFIDKAGIRALPEKFYGKRGPEVYRHCFSKVELSKMGSELPFDEDFFDGSLLP